MNELERLFKGLADVNRLRIINLLMQGELCGCDIQYVVQTSQPNVSRHLTYLKHAGLVLDRRDGYRIFYRLVDEPKDGVGRLLFEFLRPVLQADPIFQQDCISLRKAIRAGACTISELRPQPATRKSRVQLKAGRSRG